MFGVFKWIRESVRAAFLAGVQDGVNELTAAEGEALDLPALRLTLRPAVEEDGPARRKAK
jgi:hypothetical protein